MDPLLIKRAIGVEKTHGRLDRGYQAFAPRPMSVRPARSAVAFEARLCSSKKATPIEITSRRGDAVLLSRADYDALEETAHLLRVPANAKRLLESLQQARSGRGEAHALSR